MSHFPSARRLLLPALLAALAACGEYAADAPLAPAVAPALSTAPAATLLQCPVPTASSATGLIGVLGGVLRVTDSAGGTHEVSFPLNAVSLPTIFTLTVPASPYLMVRVEALDPVTGLLESVVFPAFAQPRVSISYARCADPQLLGEDLRLYNIDEQSGAVLEGPFGANDGDAADPRVEGRVPHFSAYAIGGPD